MSEAAAPVAGARKVRKDLDRAVIRFAGDSGDGMQLTGEQFTTESAWAGNDIATLPNFPAEIRAPAGTLFGVSSFQLQFGSQRVYTPGDRLDCLVAMNPAALKVHLRDLKTGGLLIVNTSAFDKRNLDKAGYAANPLDDATLSERYRLHKTDMTGLTHKAIQDLTSTRRRRTGRRTSSRWAWSRGSTRGPSSRRSTGSRRSSPRTRRSPRPTRAC